MIEKNILQYLKVLKAQNSLWVHVVWSESSVLVYTVSEAWQI